LFIVKENYDKRISGVPLTLEDNPVHLDALRVLVANRGQTAQIEEGRAAFAELRRVALDTTFETPPRKAV